MYNNYGGSASDKTAVRVDGADHSDLPTVYGFDEYIASVLDFLEK